MPVISAFADHPSRPYIRVEINWADVPAVSHARVLRYDTVTGECAALRPYICYDGDYLLLACGSGIFWDTEVPLDHPVYYITEGLDAPCVPSGDDCIPCTPVTADTSLDPLTIANDGRFWLKDPVRPCNDRPVPLCQTGAPKLPPCEDTNGILFVGIGTEVYPSNGFSLRAVNRNLTQAITRPRGGAVTALKLQTVTFTDRDDVIVLAAPGTPLLFQGPPEYGVPDRYMSVQDLQISSELPDLRIQNRTEVLPYVTVERPAGPTQGICGARVADICDAYSSWDELAATGFTWNDLVAGQATSTSANPNRRTWNDVNAEFVDWDAVNTGGRTWDGLEEGD